MTDPPAALGAEETGPRGMVHDGREPAGYVASGLAPAAGSLGGDHRQGNLEGKMNHHCRFVSWIGSSLVLPLSLSLSGCTGDEGQPARESLSIPRKGGGAEAAGAPTKGAPAKAAPAGGKLGGKAGEL